MEQTEKLVAVATKVVSKVSFAYQDKKITLAEGVAIGITAIGIIGPLKNMAEINEELKVFDAKRDVPGLVDVIKNNLDLPNDVLEAKIKTGIDIIAQVAIEVLGQQ